MIQKIDKFKLNWNKLLINMPVEYVFTFLAIIMFSFFLIIAICFFVWPSFYKLIDSYTWVKTPCVILNNEVVHIGVYNKFSASRNSYMLDIKYSYEYNNLKYLGKKYNFEEVGIDNSSKLYSIVNQYPPGFKTFCFVNPINATESVIDRGLYRSLVFSFIGLVFFLCTMVILFIVTIKRYKKKYKGKQI